jgi:arsenite methyltransferase
MRSDPKLWAECVVGATTEETYIVGFEAAGLRSVGVVDHRDYFSGSSSSETRKVAGSFGAHSVVLCAVKPD